MEACKSIILFVMQQLQNPPLCSSTVRLPISLKCRMRTEVLFTSCGFFIFTKHKLRVKCAFFMSLQTSKNIMVP